MSRLFVALDVETAGEATALARLLAPHVDGFKVGLELLLGFGPDSISAVGQFGRPVFADAKLADIPNTVERAAVQLGRRGARYVSVHAGGGKEMIAAACHGLVVGSGGLPAGILAVTVLTGLDQAGLSAVGVSDSIGNQVYRLASLAAEAGAEGVVCSVNELEVVSHAAPGLLRVTPGIRLDNEKDDQARVGSPREAVDRGADLLVVGRPITRAHDPVSIARLIVQGIGSSAASV